MSRPAFPTVIARALRLRCPKCAEGRLFETWMRMAKRCPNCDLKYERAPGYFLGSTYVNYGLTSLITTVSYVVLHFVYQLPNKTVTPPILLFVAIFPFLFFRYARSLWLSIDCFLDTTGVHTSIDEHLHDNEK